MKERKLIGWIVIIMIDLTFLFPHFFQIDKDGWLKMITVLIAVGYTCDWR